MDSVGQRHRGVQLRRRRSRGGGQRLPRRLLHQHRCPHVQFGQRGLQPARQLLHGAAPRNRRRHRPVLDQDDHRPGAVRLLVREALDRLRFPGGRGNGPHSAFGFQWRGLAGHCRVRRNCGQGRHRAAEGVGRGPRHAALDGGGRRRSEALHRMGCRQRPLHLSGFHYGPVGGGAPLQDGLRGRIGVVHAGGQVEQVLRRAAGEPVGEVRMGGSQRQLRGVRPRRPYRVFAGPGRYAHG